ncbi:MAG: tetratricopeptide repeat protein, partial [Planctomycetes bacterium]|nr:tetratricopeptide repeat protein [Planctomycetota bacterium]
MSSSPQNPELPESTESKRTCLGWTRPFKRCLKPPGPKRLFCHHHRYQRWVILLSLLTFAGLFAGLYQDAFKPLFMDDATEQKLARMDEVRARLQADLDKLVSGIGVAARWADSLAETNPEIAAHAEALAALITEFEAEVAVEKLSDEDDLRFRLAKATLANAQHRYIEVPTLVPVEEAIAEFQAAKKQIEQAEPQIDRAIELNQVLGGGFYGLREWRKALACYERILELRPDRWATRQAIAICLAKLGQLPAASSHFDEIVSHFTALVEQEGRTELANDLAICLSNRGGTFQTQGKLDDAIKDYDKAILIRTRLVEQE